MSRKQGLNVAMWDDGLKTRDFYLACFLRCTGYEWLHLRAEGRRNVGVFCDRPFRRENVLPFCGGPAMIPPRAFSTIIKDMKALPQNA